MYGAQLGKAKNAENLSEENPEQKKMQFIPWDCQLGHHKL